MKKVKKYELVIHCSDRDYNLEFDLFAELDDYIKLLTIKLSELEDDAFIKIYDDGEGESIYCRVFDIMGFESQTFTKIEWGESWKTVKS